MEPGGLSADRAPAWVHADSQRRSVGGCGLGIWRLAVMAAASSAHDCAEFHLTAVPAVRRQVLRTPAAADRTLDLPQAWPGHRATGRSEIYVSNVL